MGVDWKDQSRRDALAFQMVSPTNLNAVYGELDGVILDGSTLTAGYYTDTRCSGKVVVQGNGWRRGSFVRVVHTAPGWSNTLGTFIVTGDDSSRHHGVWEQELVLSSVLYGLSTDKLTGPYTIAKGGMGLAAIKKLLSGRGRPTIYSAPNDHRYGSAKVYETGTDALTVLYDLCTTTNNRLDVDGLGRVTVGKYVRPASKTPKFTVDLSDPRGVAHDDVKLKTDWLSLPTNAVVRYKYSDKKGNQKEIRATAWVNSKNHAARGVRGYNVTSFLDLNEMSPATVATAQNRANQLLRGDSTELVEWELKMQYIPVWEGDVVTLVVPDGRYAGKRKCLVKSLDIDLSTMEMKATLKETASGDDDE